MHSDMLKYGCIAHFLFQDNLGNLKVNKNVNTCSEEEWCIIITILWQIRYNTLFSDYENLMVSFGESSALLTVRWHWCWLHNWKDKLVHDSKTLEFSIIEKWSTDFDNLLTVVYTVQMLPYLLVTSLKRYFRQAVEVKQNTVGHLWTVKTQGPYLTVPVLPTYLLENN